jgi:hypothetical protein
MDSQNLALLKEIWRVFEDEGTLPGIELLLRHSAPGARFHFYAAGGRALETHDDVLRFFREAEQEGVSITPRAYSFEEEGDTVYVSGAIRVQRPGGGLAETQMRWSFRFAGDQVVALDWEPRSGA